MRPSYRCDHHRFFEAVLLLLAVDATFAGVSKQEASRIPPQLLRTPKDIPLMRRTRKSAVGKLEQEELETSRSNPAAKLASVELNAHGNDYHGENKTSPPPHKDKGYVLMRRKLDGALTNASSKQSIIHRNSRPRELEDSLANMLLPDDGDENWTIEKLRQRYLVKTRRTGKGMGQGSSGETSDDSDGSDSSGEGSSGKGSSGKGSSGKGSSGKGSSGKGSSGETSDDSDGSDSDGSDSSGEDSDGSDSDGSDSDGSCSSDDDCTGDDVCCQELETECRQTCDHPWQLASDSESIDLHGGCHACESDDPSLTRCCAKVGNGRCEANCVEATGWFPSNVVELVSGDDNDDDDDDEED